MNRINFELLSRNEFLETELKEVAADWSVEKRLNMSRKLARWAEQLFESAVLINPALSELYSPPDVPRGFFLVNLAKWQQNNLQKLARECGVNLRSAISWAITRTRIDLEARKKLSQLTGMKIWQCGRLMESNPRN
jgi:tRNA(Phe) wybutosine-synthesizing methylase Tyw3